MYDSILIPTDGSPGSEGAIEHAIGLAALCDAELHALYVVDRDVYSAYSGDEYVDEREGLEHALEQRGREAIDDVVERAADADVDVVEALEHGAPHETILEYVDGHDVDLTVMGTRRRPDEYRQVLGSVTDRVSRLTHRPVLIVKSSAAGDR